MAIQSKTKRIDIVLPEQTIELIDKTWPKQGFRSRSSFLNEAARRYAIRLKKAGIKRNLKDGYISRAERDLGTVSDWEVASTELI